MILRTRCPSCGSTYRLRTPPPPEGRKYRCTCGTVITIAYPEQVRTYLAERGFKVQEDPQDEPEPMSQGGALEVGPDTDDIDDEDGETLVDVPAAARPAVNVSESAELEPSSTLADEPTITDGPSAATTEAPPSASPEALTEELPSVRRPDEVEASPSSPEVPTGPTKREVKRPRGPVTTDDPDLVRMNVVGDGGAGLTRPPRLAPMPETPSSSRSSLANREVAGLLAQHDSIPSAGETHSQGLTSPSDLVDVPSLEESLRVEPKRPGPPDDFLPSPSELSLPPMKPISGNDSNEAPGPAAAPSDNEVTAAVAVPIVQAAASIDEATASIPASPSVAVESNEEGWGGKSAFDKVRAKASAGKKRTKAKSKPGKQKVRGKARRRSGRGGPPAGVGQRLGRLALWFGVISLVLGLVGLGALAAVINYYAAQVPDVDVLETYSPPTVTQIRSADGVLLGEFFEEQRYVTPIEDIPKDLQNAFVAAEDAAFWEHKGLDYMGIVRAALKNLEEGRMAQGASTITQQVARSFLLTREKKLDRKIKEAILAHRIENNFKKEHILYLYLNQIFLGHGAYGVQAAAQLYFGKDVSELSLGESAIIAGLPQAPSRYSPNKNFRKAKQRQSYVLDQMVDKGYVTREEADNAFAKKLVFSKKRNKNLDIAPYYVEHVRKYLNSKYGEKTVNNEGLQVTVPINAALQQVARQAVKTGVRRSDKIMGYRGAIKKLDTPADVTKKLQEIDRRRTLRSLPYDPRVKIPEGPIAASLLPPLEVGEYTQGVVKQVGRTWALIDIGSRSGLLPVSEFTWCHRVDPKRNFRFFKCKTVDDMLAKGDLIDVRVAGPEEDWSRTLGKSWKGGTRFPKIAMEQAPRPEAALLSLRVSDGAIISMVGGKDYLGSEFNRAMQAKRQMGSTIKPLCYAAGMAHPKAAYTPSSIFLDAPIVEERVDKEGELWTPKNSGGSFEGETTLRRGLMLSRNTVTLKVLQAVGVEYTADYLKNFGLEVGPEEANQSMCLGTASRTPVEIAQLYTPFATLGDRRGSYFVSEVRDRAGNVLEATLEGELEEDVIDEATAYQMVRLMQDVVESGTARAAGVLGVPVSGKTGTTNDFRDAWFVGFTPEIITIAWVGLDSSEGMGRGQYGGDVALPIWVEYMQEAIKAYPPSEYKQPKDIVMTLVDPKTGLLVRKGELGAWAAFKKGTEPTEFTPAPDAVDTASFLTGEF